MVSDPDITSPHNPQVKAWRSLRTRGDRDATGTFLVEGERETFGMKSRVEVVTSIVRIDRMPVDLPNIVTVSARVFDTVSNRQNSDGIAAVMRTPDHGVASLNVERPALVLVGDGIEKPGNVGAMLRTADALGAAFIGSDLGTDLVNPNVIRSAQGSLFAFPTGAGGRQQVISWCAGLGSIVVATPTATITLWELDLRQDTSVVIGSEHLGVDGAWSAFGTEFRIPMVGSADSFNASVAAAIALAEAVRQRST
jgi:RNA methyltransferase, TrmH family